MAYAPEAVAFTEAPETLATLAKQRFRWAYGTMQCLWKHRDMVLNPRFGALGFFSLPSIWFFQIFSSRSRRWWISACSFRCCWETARRRCLISSIFLVVDFLLAVLACRLEDEPVWKSWIILPMRHHLPRV